MSYVNIASHMVNGKGSSYIVVPSSNYSISKGSDMSVAISVNSYAYVDGAVDVESRSRSSDVAIGNEP